MQSRTSWIAVFATWLAPVVLFICFCIATGIGVHRVVHMGRTSDLLAHDPGCRTNLTLNAPASESAGCRIVHGNIVRAYETQEGTQYHGGTAYDQYLVFAPPSGPTAAFLTKRFYSPQPQAPPGPAVAEYVDGEIDYVTSATATIGPVFDPATDTDLGWFLIGLGVFFLLIAAILVIISILQARRRAQRGPRGARS